MIRRTIRARMAFLLIAGALLPLAGAFGAAAFLIRATDPFFQGFEGTWRLLAVLALAFLAGVLVLVVLLSEVADRWFARPVTEIARASERTAQGDYIRVSVAGGRDELSVLRRSYNTMVAAIEERERRLRELGGVDPLTEIYNRRFLQTRLEEEVAEARRYTRPVSLLLMDLDQFRDVNVHGGPPAGDALLQAVARLLRELVRVGDVVARWGGDEFAVLAPHTGSREALLLARRIQETIHSRIRTENGSPLTLSVGVADVPDCADEVRSLIAAAESALYLAKRRGTARLLYFKNLDSADLGPDDVAVLTQRLQKVTLGTVRALATAVDKRDHYTYGHGVALERMLKGAALRLHLDPHTTEVLLAGAELHDVGKIAVPDHILGKRGPLTPEEYAVMKRHPETGEEIVRAALELDDLVPAILHHHERWDGHGYPRGLKGTEIPLVARLIAIADAYHSMVSHRPYRRALTKQQAIAELHQHAGTQFDPHLVEIFLAASEEPLEAVI